MNKHLIVVVIAVLLICVGLSGCTETKEKITSKLVTASLNTLALTVDDLPQGYIKWSENLNKSGGTMQNMTPVEEYSVVLVFESLENNTGFPAIFLSLYKFNTSDEAKIGFYNLSGLMLKGYGFMDCITPENVEQIGDESIYELVQGPYGNYSNAQNTTVSLIGFRINNIGVGMLLQGIPSWEIDYTRLTIDYSKIIESKIYASLE